MKKLTYAQRIGDTELLEHYFGVLSGLKRTIKTMTSGNLAHHKAEAEYEIEQLEETLKEMKRRKL
jgi:hypothetical protein